MQFFHPPTISSLLGPNILLSTQSQTQSVYGHKCREDNRNVFELLSNTQFMEDKTYLIRMNVIWMNYTLYDIPSSALIPNNI
jgi:hypothetical protein